jgi:hypothetical protein
VRLLPNRRCPAICHIPDLRLEAATFPDLAVNSVPHFALMPFVAGVVPVLRLLSVCDSIVPVGTEPTSIGTVSSRVVAQALEYCHVDCTVARLRLHAAGSSVTLVSMTS